MMLELPKSARVFWDDAYSSASLESVKESKKASKVVKVCTSGHVLKDDEEGMILTQDLQCDDEDDGWGYNRHRSCIPRKYITKVEYFEVRKST